MPGAELTDVGPGDFTDEGKFVDSIRPRDLVFFCLNVGDGDAQVLLLPQVGDAAREAIVVDVASATKLRALIDELREADLLGDPPGIPMVVATHPHHDHIAGMAAFLDAFGESTRVFWEPGFRSTSQAYMRMMDRLGELRDVVQHIQPTAGTTMWVGQARITALSPAIGLRNRFDTYGVHTNDASISMRVEFPTSAVVEEGGTRSYEPPPKRASLLLGADSQARSWASVLNDFPKLERTGDDLARALSKAMGADHLAATVFKVSHHGSNRGSWLELISQINPRVCLITADPNESKHKFPHMVALEGIREARQATATSGAARQDDLALGIHVTGARNVAGEPLGSIATVIGPGARKLEVWRFGDGTKQQCVLDAGQRAK